MTTSPPAYPGRKKEQQLSLFPLAALPPWLYSLCGHREQCQGRGVLGTGSIRNIQTTTAGVATTWSALGTNTTDLFADLSTATAATINQIRTSFQLQRMLERDARGGTRYTERIRAHFGVISPDARLQRPEYIGGGKTPILLKRFLKTSASNLTGGSTPIGSLAATGHAQGQHSFTYAATEHGYILMLANARADLTYCQGIRKMFTRSTAVDFYLPCLCSPRPSKQSWPRKSLHLEVSTTTTYSVTKNDGPNTDTTQARSPDCSNNNHRKHRLLAQRTAVRHAPRTERHVHQRRQRQRGHQKLRSRRTHGKPTTAMRHLL